MKTNLRVWVDDMRLPPDDFDVLCSSGRYAIAFIDKYWGRIDHISLDHDLGEDDYYTGYDIAKWIEEKVHVEGWEPTFTMSVHSDNGPGRANIQAAIKSIFRNK